MVPGKPFSLRVAITPSPCDAILLSTLYRAESVVRSRCSRKGLARAICCGDCTCVCAQSAQSRKQWLFSACLGLFRAENDSKLRTHLLSLASTQYEREPATHRSGPDCYSADLRGGRQLPFEHPAPLSRLCSLYLLISRCIPRDGLLYTSIYTNPALDQWL